MGGGGGGGAGQNSVFIEKMSQLLWGELCPPTPLIHSFSVSILLVLKNFSFHFLKHGKMFNIFFIGCLDHSMNLFIVNMVLV